MQSESGLTVAIAAGLSDKKLAQKLEPLLANPRVAQVELFRRAPYDSGGKLSVFGVSRLGRRFPAWGELERFCRLLWRARRCDVIVGCFQLYHGVMAHLAGRFWGKPVIQLVVTDVGWNMERPLARWVMLGADACGTRGPASSAKLHSLGFAGPVAIIHNPASPPPEASSEPGSALYDVVAVGDNAPEKDYPVLVEALRLVKERLGGVTAMICGRGFPGPLGPGLAEAGLSGDVSFPGHLGNEGLGAAYRASRMLVLSSRVEGLPMVAVEAMAHGLPVVATDVGEVSWLLRDGLEGRLVPPGDAVSLAAAISELLRQPEKRSLMAGNSRRRAEELASEFSLSAIISSWGPLLGVAVQSRR